MKRSNSIDQNSTKRQTKSKKSIAGQISRNRTLLSPELSSGKASTRINRKPVDCAIRRDSKKQLNISAGNVPYEKAKSRRIRTREALAQSGNQNSAIALGRSKPRATAASAAIRNAPDIDAIESELENKSFLRGARIRDGKKRQEQSAENSNRSRKGRTQQLVDRQGKDSMLKRKSSSFTAVGKKKISKIDSVSDDDGENEKIILLTQLLENEAIGFGADHREMKDYAKNLFKEGLHSREMILYFFNNTEDAVGMTRETVSKWNWMKPCHKIVFCRWIQSEWER